MKHLKNILAVWGAISGIFAIALICYIGFPVFQGNSEKLDKANNKDVRFVLNWCELGEERIESVIHSYESTRSFTGDHFDAYSIKINNVRIEELEHPKNNYIKWIRGDKLNGKFKEAVDLISAFSNYEKTSWFPSKETLFSSNIYVNSWSILLHGERVTSAELIFLNPTKKIIYFASVKT